jgi:exopolysaccharide biosynthesis polyprenyl glycosylphosphotransferase
MKKKNKIFWISLLIGDFLIFYWSLYLALFLRKMGLPDVRIFNELQEPFLYLFFSWTFLYFILDFYEISSLKKLSFFLRGVFIFIFLAVAMGTVYFYFQPQLELTPRAILFLTIVNFAIFSSFWRILFLKITGLRNFKKKLFFIGYCEEMNEILEDNLSDYDTLGVYTHEKVPQLMDRKLKIFDSLERIEEIAEEIEIIVFSSDLKEDKDIIKKVFSSFPLNVEYLEFFNFYEEVTKKAPLRSLNEWWFLENISKPREKINEIVRRFFEIVASFLGVVVLLMVFPIIALLIKVNSKGKVFYKQERKGEGGKKFTLYKFRTMYDNPKKEGTPWREEDENEITRVGKILRRTHLDELPQLYNILKGDISFVGPRPEAIVLAEEFEKEIPFYRLRYLVRPGLTGWAQINYPPSMSIKEAEEKFKYDLYYIKNRSFFFDLLIILKTLRTVF